VNSAILDQIRAARDILSQLLADAEPPAAEYYAVKASFWEDDNLHSTEEAFETLDEARLAVKEHIDMGAYAVWIDKVVVK